MTLTKTKPHRPTMAHRQRTGHHHSHTHHYLKPYWPYLPIFGILVAGFIANSLTSNLHRSVLGYATDMSRSSLLSDTNAQRTHNSEAPLALNAQLDQAAQAKANDMAHRNYWSHNTPDGKTPWTFITAAGYDYQAAGENLAYGFDTAADTLTGWMNSPEHRANILNKTYKDVGFGIANIADYQGYGAETLVVAMYGSPATPPAAAHVAGAQSLSNNAPHPAAPAADKTTASKPKPTPAAAATAKGSAADTAVAEPPAQRVARVQLVAGDLPWGVLAVSLAATVALVLLLLRHSIAWHRTLIRGERFMLRHPTFDMSAAALLVVGFFLIHTAGIIR